MAPRGLKRIITFINLINLIMDKHYSIKIGKIILEATVIRPKVDIKRLIRKEKERIEKRKLGKIGKIRRFLLTLTKK